MTHDGERESRSPASPGSPARAVVITGAALAPFFGGHADLVPGLAGGLVPHRLTAQARGQIDDLLMTWVERNAAGVRLLLRSTAREIAVVFRSTTIAMGDQPVSWPHIVVRTSAGVAVHELPGGDLLALDLASRSLTRTPGDDAEIRVAVPADGEVEVLLPHSLPIEVVSVAADQAVVPGVDSRRRWLHYGSSISHGTIAPDPRRTWPQQVADGWNVQLRNLSLGGNAQLDQCVARMIRDTPADLITMCAGINLVNADSMRERTFRPAVHGFIETVRDGHPTTPLVVIGPIACPLHEATPGPVIDNGDGHMRTGRRDIENDAGALTLSRAREIVAEVVASYAGDPHLTYVDGREFFGDADAELLHDGLHPDVAGTDLIAHRVLRRWESFPG